MENVINKNISETLESNYMPYTMSVIISRAIPEIDGFKPSHRKLLYTMYKMKLLTKARTKSANVVGQTMKLNPHGDQAIYATMVRLSKGNEALLHPFVDSKGNFGKITSRDMKYAASRYTEVKLAEIASDIFKDIEKEAVEFVDNYDGQLKEPKLLPVAFPNILVNPNKGIAVGMASSFCSFNLSEVCDYTKAYIESEDAVITDYIKGPDLPTGGILIYNEEKLHKIYETGVGSFKLRAKYQYVKKDNCIEILEIPYTTTVEQIVDKIVSYIKVGKLKEISDIRDETDLKGLRIAIDLKRNVDPDKLMTKLFSLTTLEDNYSCNFNVLIGIKPKVLGIRGIIKEWLDFRVGTIRNRINYDVKEIKNKLHLLYGLRNVLLDIDAAIKIIRETEYDKEVVPNLMAAFHIDEIQAEYVADIKLRNINKEYILKKTKDIEALENKLRELEDVLTSDKKIKEIISEELERIKKTYALDRKTEIMKLEDVDSYEKEEIENYNCKIFFTEHSYLKKISLVSLRGNDVHKLKEDDEIMLELDGTNKSDILLFSDKTNVYKLKAHELSASKASSLGVYLPNILELEEDENIIYAVVTEDYEGFMIFAYENGKLARVPLKSYETKTNRKKLIKAYSDFSALKGIFHFVEEEDLLVNRFSMPDEVKMLLINTSLISEKTSKNTRGVQVVRMKKDSVLNLVVEKGKINIEDIEKYRSTKIPMSGVNIDIVDRLIIQNYIK